MKVVTTFYSSLGNKNDFYGSNKTSSLYFSGTFHSISSGILESFFIDNFCLLDTPTKVGGKKSLLLLPNVNAGE